MTTYRAHARPITTRPARVLVNPEALAGVRADAAHFPDGHATALAVPSDTAEVAWVVQNHARVLPIGSQSSLTGGATPRGDVVMAMRDLRGITRLAPDRWRVGAGVTLAELQAHLAQHDSFYPPVPAYPGAQLGGAISTNAAGPATFKYGSTRGWIEGLTVVLADGSVLELERGRFRAHPEGFFELALPGGTRRIPVPAYRAPAVAKISAGYFAEPEMDLIDLFIGAEGTLGVITEAVIRTVSPAPRASLSFVLCRDEAQALTLTAALRLESRMAWNGNANSPDVSAIEYLDAASLRLLETDGVTAVVGLPLPTDVGAALILQREAAPEGFEQRAAARLAALLADTPSRGALLAAEPRDLLTERRIMDLRAGVPLAINVRIGNVQREVDTAISKVAADMIVPYEHLGEMIRLFREEFGRLGLEHALWGHISDGNLHPNALPRTRAEAEAGQAAILRLGRVVTALGGSPLAEHGVGRNPTKQALLRQLYGEAGVEQMRSVKAALDPEDRLAPGVIFPTR